MRSTKSIARRHLDAKLGAIPNELFVQPRRGWIAAIREALGMSVRELGLRMGTSGQRVSRLEHDELTGAIQISSLARAARAMNCHVVYAIVPNEPLDTMTLRQARAKASRAVGLVSHSMRLENQGVEPSVLAEQVEDLANELVDRRGLWST